jgi:hypothetical protein
MRKVPLLFSVFAVMLVGAWVIQADAPDSTVMVSGSDAVTSNEVGMRIAIDPATGKFTEPSTVDPRTNPLNWSDEGLVEERSPVSGMMVDLQGRYQSVYNANLDDSGNLEAGCDEPTESEGE